MYETCVVAGFEATHHLLGGLAPADELHHHSYRLEVIVRGPQLAAGGILYDIAALHRAVGGLAAELNGRYLNDIPELAASNTTIECLAHYLWGRLAPGLRGQGPAGLRIVLWEDPTAYAAYEAALEQGPAGG